MSQRDDAMEREAILARRALLVSAALATLHCGPPSGPKEEGSRTSGGADRLASATTGASASRPELPPSKPWSAVLEEAPPRGFPAEIAGLEAVALKNQEATLDRDYAHVRAVWESAPSCGAKDPSCAAEWKQATTALREAVSAIRSRGFHFGSCGGATGQTGTLVARGQAHRAYQDKVLKRAEEQMLARAASFGMASEQEWLRLVADVNRPIPMPCLSPCPMPALVDISHNVLFAKNSSELAPGAETSLKGTLGTAQQQRPGGRLSVRGHADVAEQEPEQLAKARAETVAKWLVENGLPRPDVDVQAFGARLLVERPGGGAEANNQRVDFLVVPR